MSNPHEHGDAPPQWAEDFSQRNFGHPIIYGGDELSSPLENTMKHQAYKGFLLRLNGVDIYYRYHAASNPMDRMAAFHSYELYARDGSGNVSFWQGLYFSGYPDNPLQRGNRRDMDIARDDFIISSPDLQDWNNGKRCEQWYMHGGLWAWDVGLTICNATTLFSYGEHLGTPMDMATWVLTGETGLGRRLEMTHYGANNPLVQGVAVPLDRWYCVGKFPQEFKATFGDPIWTISNPVASPSACPSGYLPQYKASTFPFQGIYFQSPGGNVSDRTFPGQEIVTVPN